MKDLAILLGGSAAIIAGCCALGAGTQWVLANNQCSTIHELTGAQTNVSLSAGCLVKIDDKWMTGDAALDYKEIKIK